MTLYEVHGGGVRSQIWAATEALALKAFVVATGVHPGNCEVCVLRQEERP